MNAHSKFPMERTEAIRMLAEHFDGNAEVEFRAAAGLEYLRLCDFNQKAITGSLFEKMNAVLRSLGQRPATTFGDLTRAFQLDQRDIHKIGCSCNGMVVMGKEVARRLRSLIA